MEKILTTIGNPYLQAIIWIACGIFAAYFAFAVKRLSFGEDTGTKAWVFIAIGLCLVGLRVCWKIIFPNYADSYSLQAARFGLGLVGVCILHFGFISLYNAIRQMFKGE